MMSVANTAPGRPPRAWRSVVIAGVAIGVVYALSPLTVWFTAIMAILLWGARRGVDADERRWLTILLLLGLAARIAAVAGLFLITNHATVPFGYFFGDEEYFIRRSIWLRNVALGIPVHGADLKYAFDDYSQTSYLYVLALVQILVGPSPYGVHLLAIGCYMAACVLMFRLVRPSLGAMPAFAGLVILLFLPSQFAWSVSALRDPLFFLLTAVTVAMAVRVVRGPSWTARAAAVAVFAASAAALETIRSAGAVLAVASAVIGLMLAMLAVRPRWLLTLTIATPIVLGIVLSRPAAQIRLYAAVQSAARQHWGHIATPGYVYKLLDERLYEDKGALDDLRFGEAGRFVVRAVTRYVTVPLPWEARSASALAYLPEQVFWYLIVVFAPLGIVGSLRRDRVTAGLLLGYAGVAALAVAMISGNVGTLVRHRGLALPFVVWLSAVGVCDLIRWLDRRRTSERTVDAGRPPLLKVQPTWR
jgi:hypothetical protein